MRSLTVPLLAFAVFYFFAGCKSTPPSPSEIRHHADIPTRDSLKRKADVYLPPGYFTEKKRRYPVIYMQDGQNLFFADSAVMKVSWGADTLLDQLIDQGKLPPFILVGVYRTYRRILEYLPNKGFDQFPDSTKQRFLRSYKEPEGDWYLEILTKDIKPYIDSMYRTIPDASHTFVGGSNSGALIALYALCEHPDVFGGAACLSTHWTNSPRDLFPDAAHALVAEMGSLLPDPSTHKIYFDYGTEGNDMYYEPYQTQMDTLMAAKGYVQPVNWVTRKFPNDSGYETYWGARFGIPLEFLLSGLGN